MRTLFCAIAATTLSFNLLAMPDWSSEAVIKLGETRQNIYQLDEDVLPLVIQQGVEHTHTWPMKETGLMIPYRPMKNFFNLDTKNPLKKFINQVALMFTSINSEADVYRFLGINPWNDNKNEAEVFQIPYPNDEKPNVPYGVSLVETELGTGMTFSCAACHSGSLFGKTIFGMGNKVTRANEFFALGKSFSKVANGAIFKFNTNATDDEVEMFRRSLKNLKSVETIKAPVLGLDHSLPHVGLSITRRIPDEFLTQSSYYEKKPRFSKLRSFPSPSKPMPWWNLKYKTRWHADGSVVSGDPVIVSILWNEVGRGTSMHDLEDWINNNQDKIEQLTTAVFSAQAPHWTDFFSASTISIDKAKAGQKIFNNRCMKCHGEYEKGWNLWNSPFLSDAEKLKTVKVYYHEQTPVKDVGTDPNRYLGIKEFYKDLNRLKIMKDHQAEMLPQEGYVPPPLEGIWARYPYFHNNSVPNLCALLTPSKKRPQVFFTGPADKLENFDADCVGYYTGAKTPVAWKQNKLAKYDTNVPGQSNNGHSKALFDDDGVEMTPTMKSNLIEFLKTL